MKKLLCSILVSVMLLGTIACGNSDNQKNPDISVTEAVTNDVNVNNETGENTQVNEAVNNESENVEVDVQNPDDSSEDISSENVEIPNEEKNNVVYPVTITDQAGRTVVIEKEPEKIVSGYYISSSLLIALELDSKMVGIEAKADKRPIYKLAAEELISLPSVGSAKEFDLEGCAALQADLVILPLKLKDAAATLDELGMKTILVNPESEDLLLEMIDIISVATNKLDRAESLKSFINDKKNMLNEKLSGVDLKRVYLAGNSSVLTTAGNQMYQCNMMELAGGDNVAADIEDKYWVNTDYEQVLAWNPDYIVIAAEADYSTMDVINDVNLEACSAVVNNRVYKFPSDVEAWDSPVPSGILGSVWLAGVLHSDVISEAEISGIIEEFYETFYGFKCN